MQNNRSNSQPTTGLHLVAINVRSIRSSLASFLGKSDARAEDRLADVELMADSIKVDILGLSETRVAGRDNPVCSACRQGMVEQNQDRKLEHASTRLREKLVTR